MPRGGARPGSGRKPGDPNHPRKGKGSMGPGWGGPARGASDSRIDCGEYGDMVRALARDPANIEAKQEARELYLGTLVNVMVSSDQDAAKVAAADKFADRVDGKTRQEISGPNGGPITSLTITATDPVEAAREYQRIIQGK